MIQKMKEKVKDPKVVAIVALLAILGVENVDTASNIVAGISEAASKPATTEPPKIVLDGPESVDEGDLLSFVATDSYADHFLWKVSPELEKRFSEDGRTVFLASKPGSYELTLSASNCEGLVTEVRSFTVLNTDNCPDVPATPDPPTPTPELTGLAKKSFDLAKSAVDSKYRGDAGKVAAVYSRIASDTSISGPQALVDQTVVEIRTALGPNVEAWKSWYDQMTAAVKGEVTAGKLVTITQYRAAWSQIAKGLKSL